MPVSPHTMTDHVRMAHDNAFEPFDPDEDGEIQAPRRRARRRRGLDGRRCRGRREIATSSDATFAVPLQVAIADTSHRSSGTWAIDTANGNSWTNGSKFLEFSGADVVLYQETKIKDEDAVHSAEDTASKLGWKMSLSKATSGENGGASAGMAIAIRTHLGLSQPDVATRCLLISSVMFHII